MRDAFNELADECQPGEAKDGWMSRVDSSLWLHHIQLVLQSANYIVDVLHNRGASVLVHCRYIMVHYHAPHAFWF